MDEVAVALNVMLIFVIGLSISWASLLAWLLFEERWKRERKEKLVETILLPLLEEVEGNRGRIAHYGITYDSQGIGRVVCNAEWERVRIGLLWDALSPHGVKNLAEGLYSQMGDYSNARTEAIHRFDDIVIGVFGDFLLKKDASLDEVEVEKVRGTIKNEAYTLRNMGFDLYIEESWNALKDRYYESVSKFMRDTGRQHSDVCETSVSVEDVFGVIRRKIEGDEDSPIERFGHLRESILEDGRSFATELIGWKNQELKYLMGKEWSEARSTHSKIRK